MSRAAVCTTSIYVWLGYYYKLWRKKPDELNAIARATVTFIVGGIKNMIADVAASGNDAPKGDQ